MANRKRTPPAPPDDGGNPLARQRIIGHGLRAIREEIGASTYELAALLGSTALIDGRESGELPLSRDAMREHLAALVLLATRPR